MAGPLGAQDAEDSAKDGRTTPLLVSTPPSPKGLNTDSRVVWASPAHLEFTSGGLRRAHSAWPKEFSDLYPKLSGLPKRVVRQDWTWANLEGFLFGINPKGGQILHFMKDEAQSDLAAFSLSRNLIFDNCLNAVRYLHAWLLGKAAHPEAAFAGRTVQQFWADKILQHLAPALHALQDSFSPAHVRRSDAFPYTITEIYAWDKENKVHHKELDEAWKGTALGEASTWATTALIKCAVWSALNRTWKADFPNKFEHEVADQYLRHRFGAEEEDQEDGTSVRRTAVA